MYYLKIISFRTKSNHPLARFNPLRTFLFLVLGCFGFLYPLWGQKPQLYILNRGENNILSVPLDDPNSVLNEEINQGLLATYDFALSASSSQLYWTNSISHQILSSDEAGSISSINAITVEVAVPVDLDFDIYHNKIYWADNVRKAIYRANPDGSAQEALTFDTLPNLSSIAIFAKEDLMFFADLDSSLIWSCSLSGDDRKVFVNDSLGFPVRLLVDTIQAKLYWADDGRNRIERINLDGTKREIFYQGNEKEFPFGLYLDQTTAQLYWTDYGLDQIMRANLDGSNAAPFVTTGLNDPVAIAIVTPLTPYVNDAQDRDGIAKNNNMGFVKPSVSVYPNPANNLLTFSSLVSTQLMEQILIFDKSGKQIYIAYINGSSAQLDTSLFPEGLYSYSISIAGEMLYGRFSITR